MSDFSLPNWARSPTPSKKYSHSFSTPKTRFESIMVTNPNFGCLHFVFSKLPRAKGKMDIFKCPKKCPKKGGQIPSSILAFGRFERNIFDRNVFET